MTAPMVDYKIHWLKMMSVPESRAVVGRHDGINGMDSWISDSRAPDQRLCGSPGCLAVGEERSAMYDDIAESLRPAEFAVEIVHGGRADRVRRAELVPQIMDGRIADGL